jgi:hypothetical protein
MPHRNVPSGNQKEGKLSKVEGERCQNNCRSQTDCRQPTTYSGHLGFAQDYIAVH